MKKLLLLLIFLVMIFSVSAVCEDKVACVNQNDDLFCNPTDTTCEYVKYDSDCQQLPSTDTDNDADGWTDKCDAFPSNESEWIDIDGDSYGYNYDCDDFDSLITVECYNSVDQNETENNETEIPQNETETNETETPKNETQTNTTKTSGGGGGSSKTYCTAIYDCTEWSSCSEGIRTRTCTQTNECDEPWNDHPEETKGCPLVTELNLKQAQAPSDNNDEPENIDRTPREQNETQEGEGLPAVTGQFLNVLNGNFASGNLLLLLLAILLLFIFFWARRKKKE